MVAWRTVRQYCYRVTDWVGGVMNKNGCSISTGRQEVLGVGSSNDERSSKVLFDKNSTTKFSHFIEVDPCGALQLSAFGLPDNVNLILHRVIVGGGVMPQGSGCICGVDPAKPAKTLFSNPFKIDCKPVVLNNCNTVLFLTVPGTYVVEVSDPSALGKFIAYAEPTECCCLPNGLVIGNTVLGKFIGTKEVY